MKYREIGVALAVAVPACFVMHLVGFQLGYRTAAAPKRYSAAADAEDTVYPTVDVARINDGKWYRPRAVVSGTVEYVAKEADGDWHFRIVDEAGQRLVCEIDPDLPLQGHPAVGDRVVVQGIVRYDGEHKWWEIHPVTRWSKQ